MGGRDTFGGAISYSANDSAETISMNDSMNIEDDGYKLGFRPLGLRYMGRSSQELLTPHGAAEYLWSVMIAQLQ
jgi:hypothetical protein